MYLFDTFNGFDERDVEVENTIGEQSFVDSSFNKVGHLADTTVQLVMDKMLYPKNVVIKKGWIPDTFHGMDGRFCFVHPDMDLYLPMLAGLQYFYPKISRRILLHDYFLADLSGVKKAVEDYEKEIGRALIKVPLGDGCTLMLIQAI